MSRNTSRRLRALVQMLAVFLVVFSTITPIVSAAAPSGVAADDPPATSGPELSVELHAEPVEATLGQLVALSATIRNTGDTAVEGLNLDLALPASLEYDSSDAPGATYDAETGRLTWQIDELSARASTYASIYAVAAEAGE
jgi:hypothetical protein